MDTLHNQRWMVLSDGTCVWAYDSETEAQEHLDSISKYHVQGYNHAYILQQESGCYPLDYPSKWEQVNTDILIPEDVAIAWVKGCKYTMNEGYKHSSFWNKDYYVVARSDHWHDKRRLAIYKHDNKIWLLIEKSEGKESVRDTK